MASVLMMVLENCPYCREALGWIEELKAEDPRYGEVPVRIADEEKEEALASSLDYYYVPSCFVNGKKVHEGAASKEKMRAVLDAAING